MSDREHVLPENKTFEVVNYFRRDKKTDFAAIHPQLCATNGDNFWINHRNLLVWLKNKGKIVVNYIARTDPYWNKTLEAVSDLVVRVYFRREGNGELHPEFLVWRQGFHPRVVGFRSEDIGKLASYSRELAKLARHRLGGGE